MPSVGLGSTVRVYLYYTATPAWGLYGLDVFMDFDAAHLQVIDACPDSSSSCPAGVQIAAGPLVTAAGPQFAFFNTANNVAGSIHYALTLLAPALPIYSSGSLAFFDVQTSAVGTHCMHITQSLLSTEGGRSIPHSVVAETCIVVLDPTAATIVSFSTATGNNKSVVVNWTTSSEVANLGFNLYRTETIEGKKSKLNRDMIPTLTHPGAPNGATYGYVDTKVDKSRAISYFYWLESAGPVRPRAGAWARASAAYWRPRSRPRRQMSRPQNGSAPSPLAGEAVHESPLGYR